MRETNRRQGWVRLARTAALGAGVLLLAGCATGYSFVQPDVTGSGGYYTSEESYSGQGYYDDYGTGPYYPGTSGYGYYDGSYPYSSPYGYYGGDYGYGPQWTFNLGISNVWNFPGYWGPWYTTGYPSWGCYAWRCGNHRRHHHKDGYRHDHRHDRGDHVASRSGLNPDTPPRLAPGTPPVQIRSLPVAQRPQANFADRRPADVSAFRHDRFVHAPRQYVGGRPVGAPARPVATRVRAPAESAFANRPRLPIAFRPAAVSRVTNRAPRVMPRPTVRPVAPARAAPVAPAPPRHDVSRRVKIQ